MSTVGKPEARTLFPPNEQKLPVARELFPDEEQAATPPKRPEGSKEPKKKFCERKDTPSEPGDKPYYRFQVPFVLRPDDKV